MAETIVCKLTGIVQIGHQGTPHDFSSVGILPSNRNEMLQIVVLGNGQPIYLTLRHNQAEKLAAHLITTLHRSTGSSQP
jgi:hypothetical protein